MMKSYNVVTLRESHLAGTAELEKLCFSCPWTESALKTLVGENGVGFAILDENERVISYAGMVIAADTGDITDVATHPDFRRQGLSRAIMEHLFSYSREMGLTSIALEVRTSNTGAIALYEGLGFIIAGKRPRFYRNPPEDAYVMIKHL